MKSFLNHEQHLAAMCFSLMNFMINLCLAHTSQHHLANLIYPGWATQGSPPSDML